VALNLPGQSGHPDSPHFRDLYAPWLEAKPFPLLFGTEAVEAAVTERIVLKPAQE
jgi:penicillin amidase